MGKKGENKHLKREAAPRFWPIHRKERVWTLRPVPGPHPIERCLPLALVIRDMLSLAKTGKEAKIVLSRNEIRVDGVVRRDEGLPIGTMDVISVQEDGKDYRVLPSERGFILHPIEGDEGKFKLCRVENKKTVKGGHIQLHLHDGRNFLIRVNDPKKPEEDVYHTFETLMISVPDQKVVGHLKLTEGAPVMVIGGKNVGKYGKLVAVERTPGQERGKALVTVEDKKGERFQTTLNYVFVIGDREPSISIPEAD